MVSTVERAAWKKPSVYLYYLNCLLHLEKEKASSSEARLLLKTHPDYAVGFYTRDADRKMILDDAVFTRDALLKKQAA